MCSRIAQLHQIDVPDLAGAHAAQGQVVGGGLRAQPATGEFEHLVGHQPHLVEGMADEQVRDGKLFANAFQVGDDLEPKIVVQGRKRLVH